MKCNEFEKMIPRYLKNELKDRDLKEYLSHVNSCDSCKEEMTIQYLITEGMQRLEEGNTFDVEKELGDKMHQSMKHLERKRLFREFLGGVLTVLVVCGLAVMLWFVII